MDNKKRLQFDFDQEALKTVERMELDLKAPSKAEVIRKALSLLDKAIVVIKNGGEVILRDNQGKEKSIEFLIP